MKTLSLSLLLSKNVFPDASGISSDKQLKLLQFKLLRIQQGIWHSKRRAIIVFEGFDTAGKGGTIRKVIQKLDPRGVRVHSIAAPDPSDQAKHYLYRFWKKLPDPGTIAVFDRSWYGRVLVERVNKLIGKDRLKDAYAEINHFESMLVNDGIEIIKIFLAIHPEEQLSRFKERLSNPYKHWKLTNDDVVAHSRWNKYVEATDDLLKLTHTKLVPWHLIPADSKSYTHLKVLKIITTTLQHHGSWIEAIAKEGKEIKMLKKELKLLSRD